MVAPQKRTRVAVVGMWTQSFKIAWDNTPWTSHLDLWKSLNIHWNLMRIRLKSHQKLHPKSHTPTISMHGIHKQTCGCFLFVTPNRLTLSPIGTRGCQEGSKAEAYCEVQTSERRIGYAAFWASIRESENFSLFFLNRMMLSFGCSTMLIQYI